MYKNISTVLFCVVMPMVTHAASFDCKKAKQPLEKLICTNPELSAVDEKMGVIYKETKASFPLKEFVSDTQIYFVAGDYKNCMYINDDWSKPSSSPQAVENCVTVVQKRIDELKSYQQSKVYSDAKAKFSRDENLIVLIYQNNASKKAMRLWGNWMPSAFIDEKNPPEGFQAGHICDFNVELIPTKDGFKSDETADTVFKITESSLNISEFISCSPRTGIGAGDYKRIIDKKD